MMHSKPRGFSLLEISVALVILGILMGMVFTVTDLITQARLKAVMSEVNEYRASIALFEGQYRYLPGDFPTATTLWPTAGATNDGDGNWSIDGTEDAVVANHLGLSGLYTGNYTAGGALAIGINVPSSSLRSGGYRFTTGALYTQTMHHIEAGSPGPAGLNNGAVSLSSARFLDDKFDDGAASSGSIITANGANAAGCDADCCVDAALDANAANYLINDSGETFCMLYFRYDQELD